MIFVTGDWGFIGGKLTDKLKPPFEGMDLKTDEDILIENLPQADIVYHLAAQTSVEDSWDDPVEDSKNLAMTIRIATEYPDSKIIFTQSAASLEPMSSPYAFSKWASGEYLKQFHKNTVICILPNVYGGSNKSVVDLFKDKEEVTVYGDGMQIRDYVHVDDIVDALILAQEWEAGEYLLGSGVGTTVLELTIGKKVNFSQARKEARESTLPNTTPDWNPKIDVIDYIYA